MRRLQLILLLATVSTGAFAQTSLQDQINSVYNAQERNRQNDRAAWEAQQVQIRRDRERQSAAAAHASAVAAAAQHARDAAADADKARNRSYEDQLRAMDIQQRQLKIQAEKARVDRANEFIDQDLQSRSAATDVVRSEADVNRNVSSGIKSYLDQAGQAEVKKQSLPAKAGGS